jgi:hypothetical protein
LNEILRTKIIQFNRQHNEILLKRGFQGLVVSDAQITAYTQIGELAVPTGHTISFIPNPKIARIDKLLPKARRLDITLMWSNPFYPDVTYVGHALLKNLDRVGIRAQIENEIEETLSHEALHQTMFPNDELDAGLLFDNLRVINKSDDDEFEIKSGFLEEKPQSRSQTY